MEKLLEAVLSARSVPRLYNKDQQPLEKSLERAVTRAGGCVRWTPVCEGVSPEAEECPLLEDVTKQRSEDCD
jgi:hypothetical protein